MRTSLIVFALLVVAPQARAQSNGIGVSGGALAYQSEYRLRYVGGLHDQSGTWFGAEAAARLGRVLVRMSGLTGTLSGDTSVVNPNRTVRITTVSLGVQAAPWLEVGADVMARRFESGASTVLWQLLGGHIGIELPLGLEGLTGTVEGAYYPSATVTGDEKLGLAMSGQLGISYTVPRPRIVLRLAYRFERYDFGAVGSDPARLEQLRAVVAGVGLRLGR